MEASIELDGGDISDKKTPSLTILSGTFTGEISVGSKGTLYVKGGKMDGIITKDTGSVVCTGGLFKEKPEDDLLQIGYIVAENQIDGYFQVEADKAAQIKDKTYDTLSTALRVAKDGDTVILLKDQTDIRVNVYSITNKSIVLDLNGKTVSTPDTNTISVNSFKKQREITIKNGTIRNTNHSEKLSAGIGAEQQADLTLENVTVETDGTNSCGVYTYLKGNDVQPVITVKGSQTKIYGKAAGIAVMGDNATKSPATLIVEDGIIEGGWYGIAGNGAQNNTNITINGGTIRGGDCGIFHPQYGQLHISGGTIEGATGVEMRAGELNVSGNPVITATGEYASDSNASGSTSSGVGIAIAQHVTNQPISVNIAGGTVNGVKALEEINPQGNSDDNLSQVKMEVTGGRFVGEVSAADVSKFISGGTYSTDPTGFVDDDSYAYKMNNQYVVAPEGYQAADWIFEKDTVNDRLYIGTYHSPYIPPVSTDPITNTGSASSASATTNADISKDPASTIEEKTETADDKTEITTTTVKIAPETAEKIVQRAIQHSSALIVIDATTDTTPIVPVGTRTQVVLPATTLRDLASKTTADVVIKSDVAEIKLDGEAVHAIAEQTATAGTLTDNDTVTILAEKTKDENKEMQFELKVVTSKGLISDFDGGNVSVKVQLNDDLRSKERLACLYIEDSGWYSRVQGTKNADGSYSFVTGHFSTYAIMEENEANKLIEKQTSLTKGVQNTTIKLTSSLVTKGIKLKWKKSKGFKVDAYQVYRGAKKNGKYTKIYSTKKGTTTSMINRKDVKKGKRYFYKMRGVRTIAGKTFYTKWSNKAYRIYK